MTRCCALVLLAGTIAGCATATPRPPLVQAGAPGDASRPTTVTDAVDLGAVQHTDADIRFMHGMIAHHAQALEMTALLPARTQREPMRLLAARIDASQRDEIDFMRNWLAARGAATDEHAHMHHGLSGVNGSGPTLMPGMLTPADLAQLAAAMGPAFDRLFLEFMIKHHVGALSMVNDLFATPGAGQEAEIFAFAADVDADQRIDIRRMRAMLQEFQP